MPRMILRELFGDDPNESRGGNHADLHRVRADVLEHRVELLTEKNNYLAAQQEQIQAKYQAVLSIRLLDFYRNVPIEL